MEAYDYQPINGSKKRTAPKDGFDSLLPSSKRHSSESPAAIAHSQAEYSNAGRRMRWQQAIQAGRFGEEIAELKDALSQTGDELTSQRSRRRDAEYDVLRHGKRIIQLKRIISRKNGELHSQCIRSQEVDANAARDGEDIASLKTDVSQRNEELERLRIDHQSAVENFRQEKEQEKRNIRQDAYSIIADQKTTITELQAAYGRQQAEVQHLREQEVASRDAMIVEQQAEMLRLREQIASRDVTIAEQEAEIRRLHEQKIASRDLTIAEQQAEIQRLCEQEVALREEVYEKKQDNCRILQVAESFIAKQEAEIERLGKCNSKDIVDQSVATGLPSPPKEEIANNTALVLHPQQIPTNPAVWNVAEQTPGHQSDALTLPRTPMSNAILKRPLVKKPQRMFAAEERHGKHRASVSHPTKTGGIIKSSGRSGVKSTQVAGKTDPSKRQNLDTMLKNLQPLHLQSEEPIATAPDDEEEEVDESTDRDIHSSLYGLATYLHTSRQTSQAITKQITGAFIDNEDGTHAFWFQELGEGRVFTAQVTLADLTPGTRKRFLPYPDQEDFGKDEQTNSRYMCVLAQLPELQIEAAWYAFRKSKNREELYASFKRRMTNIFGTCTNCDERSRYSELWEYTVVWLAGTLAFRVACRAFGREERMVDGCGPWPARFTDPKLKWRTSLQPDVDQPEDWKPYKEPLDDDEADELTEELYDQAAIDPIDSMCERWTLGTDAQNNGEGLA